MPIPSMTRRNFLRTLGAGAAGLAFSGNLLAAAAKKKGGGAAIPPPPPPSDKPDSRPNFLWIMSEDISTDLACYGTPLVHTPVLDQLAADGARYTNAFCTSPVCSPSRSSMITGMFQTSIGSHDHRSNRDGALPPRARLLTDCLRDAGYFTCNVTTAAVGVSGSGKTDFNFQYDGKPFDGTDWNQRKSGQPFFAQLSLPVTHRTWAGAQAYVKKAGIAVDADKVKLPPYYPDHPVAREDWAHYLDSISTVDWQVGEILKRLEAEGLAKNTVVFFIGDNGACHVRGKQWLYEAGISIPLIVRWPGTIKPGTVSDDLVLSIDIPGQILKIAGVTLPVVMQDAPFIGPDAFRRKIVFAARDRMDETVDCCRTVRDKQWKYIRNFMPHLPYLQPNRYKDTAYPMANLLRQLHAEGKLTPAQQRFAASRKPAEELYDLAVDRDELVNLAEKPEHQETLKRMRAALRQCQIETHDLGFAPEGSPSHGAAVSRDPKVYPLGRILDVCDVTARNDPADLPQLIKWLDDENVCIRYWTALGVLGLGAKAAPAADALVKRLDDPCGVVRVPAAEALCGLGQDAKGIAVLEKCLGDLSNGAVSLHAANALERLGEKARPCLPTLERVARDGMSTLEKVARDGRAEVVRTAERLVARFKGGKN